MMTRGILRKYLALSLVFVFFFATPCYAKIIQIKIIDMTFTPAVISASVGDTIEFINNDFVAHTATATDHSWDVMIPPNTQKQLAIKIAGTAHYICRFHPTMKGMIVVDSVR